jgi:hypothetical protein
MGALLLMTGKAIGRTDCAHENVNAAQHSTCIEMVGGVGSLFAFGMVLV